LSPGVPLANPVPDFQILTRHVDRLAVNVCLCHGDLNFANQLTDERGNVWVIDWAYAGPAPLALDFAKMENDLKFVLTKGIGAADVPHLLELERFLLENPTPPAALPPALDFVAGRFEFIKLLDAVRTLRRVYATVNTRTSWDVYAVALLKFAVHTLSFDARRGRGECQPAQLKYALASTSLLIERLKNSQLHRNARQDRPESYPERLVVPADRVDWSVAWTAYRPPYHVASEVLANASRRESTGWADPERLDALDLGDRTSCHGGIDTDAVGRPLNPGGRTGIQGRGLLGRWGPNPAVDPVVSRLNPISERLEIVLVKRADTGEWGLPGTMLYPGEPADRGARRALEAKAGLQVALDAGCLMGWTGVDDYRNTDHAWIESAAMLRHLSRPPQNGYSLRPGSAVQDAAWVPVTRQVVDSLYANHAHIVGLALRQLLADRPDGVDQSALEALLLWI
jgi:ADP-ribose pyrophosphatase